MEKQETKTSPLPPGVGPMAPPVIDYNLLANALAAKLGPTHPLVTGANAELAPSTRFAPSPDFGRPRPYYDGKNPEPMLAFVLREYEHNNIRYYDCVGFRANSPHAHALISCSDADFAQ